MIYKKLFAAVFLGCLLTLACQRQDQPSALEEIEALPMNSLPLETLQAFQSHAANWQIAGRVLSDYQTHHSIDVHEGTGVLVNQPTVTSCENLYTELEHGDIELKVEFLVPKGSNSGLYFQSRYELQLLDSWNVEEPTYKDLGGIYQRWDEFRPAGERGYEGYAPVVNASLAPGLWQEFHILFRAPRFNEDGIKISNAKFEEVWLNGMLIHKDVELSGPTRGAISQEETELAPIMIQGDHGPVVFRNFRYKTFNRSDSLSLSQLDYTVYDFDGVLLPDFDTLTTVLAEGVTDSFKVSQLSPKNEYYAVWFTGNLDVPVSGNYLFQTQISNGGNLYINDELIIPNDGEVDSQLLGNIIHLEEGTYKLDMSYFKVKWAPRLSLFYEGPNMERRTLASSAPSSDDYARNPLTVQSASVRPELIGGFTHYRDKKRTHTLSVGDPEGVHYSYDLYNSSLLKFWRGPFADVTQMWRGRGYEQLLIPMNAAVEDETGITVGQIQEKEIQIYGEVPDQLIGQEFVLNDTGRPIFKSKIDGISIEDELYPAGNSAYLTRVIRYETETNRNDIVSIIARGKQIERLPHGLFRVNGKYYIELKQPGGQEAAVFEKDGLQILAVPVLRKTNRSDVQFHIIW